MDSLSGSKGSFLGVDMFFVGSVYSRCYDLEIGSLGVGLREWPTISFPEN
jgi:hypothetical protein